jgi:putative ATP-dependent endonuclease of OLD family
MVLSIDEPEVHLHPYLQRSLIRFYKRILANEDQDFLSLLKNCFGIDGLLGQLLIVTHSTDALVDDYQNIVRFYKEDNITKIISGADPTFVIPVADKKQLIMRFPEIKEAFFAHVVILIEGETEYGCIPSFAEKLGIFLDDYSICVVNAQGEGKIKPLASLFSHFGIKTVLIYDGDVQNGATPSDTEFYSTEPCFEFEVMRSLCNTSNYQLARDIAIEVYPRAMTEIMDADYVKKPYTKKLGLDINNYVPTSLGALSETDPDFYNLFSCWFYAKKGVLTGRIIGEMLTDVLIPNCYRAAIQKAKEIAGEMI